MKEMSAYLVAPYKPFTIHQNRTHHYLFQVPYSDLFSSQEKKTYIFTVNMFNRTKLVIARRPFHSSSAKTEGQATVDVAIQEDLKK